MESSDSEDPNHTPAEASQEPSDAWSLALVETVCGFHEAAVHVEARVYLSVAAVHAPHLVESLLAGAVELAPGMVDRLVLPRDRRVDGRAGGVVEHDDVAGAHRAGVERRVVALGGVPVEHPAVLDDALIADTPQ